MKLNELIDQWVELKSERVALARKDKELSQQIAQLQSQIMDIMNEVGTTQARSAGGLVSMKQTNQPTVVDWSAFYAYVAENDAFDLLQRRLSPPAFRARWDSDEEVPGTTAIPIWSLTLSTSK